MTIVKLARFCYEGREGVFGRLSVKGFECYTVERPWVSNTPFISCIPVGVYELGRTMFNKGGYESFEVLKVPERSAIKFHRANIATDVQGCIGVGLRLGTLKWRWAVEDSGVAYEAFMDHLEGIESAILSITNAKDIGIA